MEVIKASSEHINGTISLYKEVIEYLEANVNYPVWHFDSYPSPKSITENINNGTQYICINQKKEIVGGFVLNFNPDGNYHKYGKFTLDLKDGEYYVIHTFAVSPKYSRKGYGKVMIDYVKKLAKEKGIKSIRCDVVSTNTPANSLYLKNGFKFVGEGGLDRNIHGIKDFKLFECDV